MLLLATLDAVKRSCQLRTVIYIQFCVCVWQVQRVPGWSTLLALIGGGGGDGGVRGGGGGQFCRALVQMPLAILFCDNANTVIVNRVLLTVI